MPLAELESPKPQTREARSPESPKLLSRRNFLRGAAGLSVLVAGGGGTLATEYTVEKSSNPEVPPTAIKGMGGALLFCLGIGGAVIFNALTKEETATTEKGGEETPELPSRESL